jgi:arylsulfatase A
MSFSSWRPKLRSSDRLHWIWTLFTVLVGSLPATGIESTVGDTAPVSSLEQESNAPPHIVLIAADDLGVFDLGCYGRTDHRTPHLDRLAGQGVRFASGYCGLPICSASRAALMTGKNPARLHLTSYLPGRADAPSQRLLNAVIEPQLIPSEQTLAEVLKRSGYSTGIFGKWHLGGGVSSPKAQGFDVVFEPPGNGDPATEGGKNEYLITDKAIEFLKASGGKPCLCYIPHHSPHIMLKEMESKVAANAHAWNPLYASSIESLDAAIGRLLQAIDETPELANTWVIFTSDNGGLHVPEGYRQPVTHNGPYRAGKGYLYEGGLRVPLLMRWPGNIPAGRVIEEPVSLMDILPTILNAIGIDPARSVGPLDGQSVLPILQGASSKPSDRTFYWHLPHYTNQGSKPTGAIRKGRWKLVHDYETDAIELFDLDVDVAEAVNVASQNSDIAQDLKRSLGTWKQSVGAQQCQPNPEWNADLHRTIYIDRDSGRLRGQSDKAADIGEAWAPWREAMNQAIAGRPTKLKLREGAVWLEASQGTPHGTRLRYEPETYKNVLGYWTEVADWAEWTFDCGIDGPAELEIHCGCGSGGGSQIDVVLSFADGTVHTVPWTVRETGHFQNIVIEDLGTVNAKPGKATLEVRPRAKKGAAIVDIRNVVIRPLTPSAKGK